MQNYVVLTNSETAVSQIVTTSAADLLIGADENWQLESEPMTYGDCERFMEVYSGDVQTIDA